MTGPKVVRVGGNQNTSGGVITGLRRPTSLDELADVEGAASAPAGSTLVKQPNGRWYGALLPAGEGGGPGGPLSYVHTQDVLSSVWLIVHSLGFQPAGVDVVDHLGRRHYPRSITHPNPGATTQLSFDHDVRGTAHLS